MVFSNMDDKKLAKAIMQLFHEIRQQYSGSVGIEIKAIIKNTDKTYTDDLRGGTDFDHDLIIKSAVARMIYGGVLRMEVEPSGAVMIYFVSDLNEAVSNGVSLYDTLHTAARLEQLVTRFESLREYIHLKLTK